MLSRLTPYPDELFYSVIARYHVWSRNPTKKETMGELFEKERLSQLVGLPSRLSIFSKHVNHKKITPSFLINNITFFPLYRPFISKERSDKVSSLMKETVDNNGRIQMILGHLDKNKKYLHYCPKCVKENEDKYGEPYWHRSHQIFGVFVCPHHNVKLKESTVLFFTQKLIPLNKEISKTGKKSPQLKGDPKHYYSVAKGVYWLLNNHPKNLELKEIAIRYKYLLQDTGYTTYKGNVRFKSLIQDMNDYFGEDFLKDMQAELYPKKKSCWIRGIFKHYVKAVHPTKHLILLTFLHKKPQDFFDLKPKEIKPFGEGPWICLNPVADHFNQPVLNNCHISSHSNNGKSYGTFTCSCGYIYTRIGPDKNQSDRYLKTNVKSYGHVWERKLLDGVLIQKKSFRQLAKEFKSDRETLKKHFDRLNNEGDSIDYFSARKEECRTVWTELLVKHPEKSKTDLRRLSNAVYKWLYQNDRDWLDLHSPKPVAHVPKNSDGSLIAKDWGKIDKEIASKVKEIAKEVAYKDGKPKRVSITAISRIVRNESFLSLNLYRLPITNKSLKSVVESNEDFRLRKLKWVLKALWENNQYVSSSAIKRKVGVRTDSYTEQMKKLIEEHLKREI